MKRRKNERGRTRKGDRDRDSFDVLCYNTSQSQLKGFVKNAWHAHNWKISNELKEIKIKWFHTHPDFKESTWLEEKKIERGRKKIHINDFLTLRLQTNYHSVPQTAEWGRRGWNCADEWNKKDRKYFGFQEEFRQTFSVSPDHEVWL